jgi:hypothetical protein
MTRAEIRIAAAKKRAKAAEAALSRAYERKRAAVAAASDKTNPAIWAASRKVSEARQAVAVAELAALGITPMRTIILWHPKGYTAPSAQNRYVVRVTREGWKRLVPVGKTGVILARRNEQYGPYSTGWSKVTVTVTDEEVKV